MTPDGLSANILNEAVDPRHHAARLCVFPKTFAPGMLTGGGHPSDPELGLVSISARDVYGFGVLVIGLTLFLSHQAPIANRIHFLIIHRAGDALVKGRDGLSLYDVTKEAILYAGGAILAFYAPSIGERLVRTGRFQSIKPPCDNAFDRPVRS